eukprot:scaffold27472_cov90-Phaeocystis_antarctica.AAC.2
MHIVAEDCRAGAQRLLTDHEVAVEGDGLTASAELGPTRKPRQRQDAADAGSRATQPRGHRLVRRESRNELVRSIYDEARHPVSRSHAEVSPTRRACARARRRAGEVLCKLQMPRRAWTRRQEWMSS